MLRGFRSRLSYANVVSTLGLFIALGGVSYAAVRLPRNSVGAKQIRRNAVTGSKVKNNSLTGSDVRNSSLTGSDVRDGSLRTRDFRAGDLPGGAPGQQGPKGDAGAKGDAGPGSLDAEAYLFDPNFGIAACAAVKSVVITAPSAGHVAFDARGFAGFSHLLTKGDALVLVPSSKPGDCATPAAASNEFAWGDPNVPDAAPAGTYNVGWSAARRFPVATAATYTYYLNGRADGATVTQVAAFSAALEARFYPAP